MYRSYGNSYMAKMLDIRNVIKDICERYGCSDDMFQHHVDSLMPVEQAVMITLTEVLKTEFMLTVKEMSKILNKGTNFLYHTNLLFNSLREDTGLPKSELTEIYEYITKRITNGIDA